MNPVCGGATLACTCGSLQTKLNVLLNGIGYSQGAAATIFDCLPIINIPPFGTCIAPGNPQLLMPIKMCIPAFVPIWLNQVPSILLQGLPVLDDSATLICLWGGLVSIQDPGQQYTHHTPQSIVQQSSGSGSKRSK